MVHALLVIFAAILAISPVVATPPTAAPTYECSDTNSVALFSTSLGLASLAFLASMWYVGIQIGWITVGMTKGSKMKLFRMVSTGVLLSLAVVFEVAGGAVFSTSCNGILRALNNLDSDANKILVADLVITNVLVLAWLSYVLKLQWCR